MADKNVEVEFVGGPWDGETLVCPWGQCGYEHFVPQVRSDGSMVANVYRLTVLDEWPVKHVYLFHHVEEVRT